MRACVGEKARSVEYWNQALTVAPSGLTVPGSVAELGLVTTALPVTATAGARRSSSASS
jgi:hypothetical protein